MFLSIVSRLNQTNENYSYYLRGEVTIYNPSQGWNICYTYPFYFHAQSNEWTFAVSEHSDIDPIDIQNIESGKKYGFYKEGKFDNTQKSLSDYIAAGEIEKLVAICCNEYSHKE